MKDGFTCPRCGEHYLISDLELWEVYEGDGAITDFECEECGADIEITSSVIGWDFTAEVA